MKKIVLVIILILLAVTNICFAEDIYMFTEDGFSKYLRTDSIKAVVTPKAEQESLFEMTYDLVLIPDKDTLARLKSETFDNKISFRKQSFTFKCSFNKTINRWYENGSIWINRDEFWGDVPERCLYQFHGHMPGGAYYGNTPAALNNRSIIIAAYNYVVSRNLIEYH